MEVPVHKLSKITDLSNPAHFDETLKRILVPRVVGTDGHEEVKTYIVDTMKKLNWNVELDEFRAKVPIFTALKFSNIIAKLNPDAERFLVLACHYDSKYFENEEFLGATDSAVPCAMMINIAYVLKDHLDSVKSNNDLSIMMIFFDGEEAFKQWSASDSIYGARHLAKKWETEGFLPKIDLMVLLDLLGSPDPTFYSFFKETEKLYARLLITEERLDNASLLERYSYSSAINRNPSRYFQANTLSAYIEDDHIPFLRRNVPILHMIPTPFPEVWHKMTDNHEAIDVVTVENLSKILRIFIVEYLHIDP